MRPPKVNICIPILRGHSTRPKGWVEVMYFRSKAVLGLPVSTTSYSRHAVSTIQSPISTADNDRSLIDSDGAKAPRNPVLRPYLYIIPARSHISISISILKYCNISRHNLCLASNWKLLDFYIFYLSRVTRSHSTSTVNS